MSRVYPPDPLLLPPRVPAAPPARVNTELIAECVGAVEAQKLLDGLRDEMLTTDHGWLAFCELATRHGWKSTACRAFLLEIVKRARTDATA